MRILFIYFQNVLEAWENSVNGTLKRQQMHLEAIKEIAHIDILSYVPVNTDISLKAVNEGEKRLSQKLGTKDIIEMKIQSNGHSGKDMDMVFLASSINILIGVFLVKIKFKLLKNV
jgi:hypothetical protein